MDFSCYEINNFGEVALDVKEIKNWHRISIIMWGFCSFKMDLVENENL
jgi:hypothetical protein